MSLQKGSKFSVHKMSRRSEDYKWNLLCNFSVGTAPLCGAMMPDEILVTLIVVEWLSLPAQAPRLRLPIKGAYIGWNSSSIQIFTPHFTLPHLIFYSFIPAISDCVQGAGFCVNEQPQTGSRPAPKGTHYEYKPVRQGWLTVQAKLLFAIYFL